LGVGYQACRKPCQEQGCHFPLTHKDIRLY
jgi:hypothetical protein